MLQIVNGSIIMLKLGLVQEQANSAVLLLKCGHQQFIHMASLSLGRSDSFLLEPKEFFCCVFHWVLSVDASQGLHNGGPDLPPQPSSWHQCLVDLEL